MKTMLLGRALAGIALGASLCLAGQALAAPDFMNFQVVVQPDGAFTAEKLAEVFLEGNPDDPFPGDGLNTYAYTITNQCGSPLPLVGFSVGVPPGAVGLLPVSFGPGVPPNGPGVLAGAEVEWDFTFDPIDPCETSQKLFLLSDFSPGVMPHNIVSIDGDLSFDASTLCLGPFEPPVEECVLEIDKTCCIPSPPMPGVSDLCGEGAGKVTQMVLEYTGDDCSASNNPQSGKATCSGDTNGSQPVSITITKDPAKVSATPSSGINVGDNVTFNAVSTELGADTVFKVMGPGGTQTLSIHTSCSQVLACGDVFGSMRLVSLTTTGFGTTVCPDPDEEPQEESQCVAPGDAAGTKCDGEISQVVFEYTGEACQMPLPNPQGGKATCSGDPNDAEPVSVTYTGANPSKITVSPASGIDLGEAFSVTATAQPKLEKDTKLVVSDVGGVVQNLKIRTSCSKPLRLGDEFGSLKVIGMTSKNGGSVALADPDATPFQDACEAPLTQPSPHCTDKVEKLHLAYIDDFFGLGCSVSNPQGGKASCTGVDDPGDPVSITITKDPALVTATPDSGIGIPDIFVLEHSDGKLAASTEFEVSGAGGTQAIKIRTSCSKPLNLLDRFGSVVVVGIHRGDGDGDPNDGDDGFVGIGSPVEFQYKVTNPNASPATDVTVEDNLFGTIGSGLVVPGNGGMVTLFETRTLYSTLTNTATVTGVVNEQECSAEDSVTTTIEGPPSGFFNCNAAKPLDTITMIWNGGGTIRLRAWRETPGEILLADIDPVFTGQTVSVSGYAGSSNDVIWEIFQTGTLNKIGESSFHLSCSDSEMNGVEDCGKLLGNNKSNSPMFINDWIFEGMAGNGMTLDCTPDPIMLPGPGFCGLGFELALLLPPLLWMRRRVRG